jgi:hypothetical protein
MLPRTIRRQIFETLLGAILRLKSWGLRHTRTLIVDASVTILLILSSIGTFLFGHGYYDYADQTWPFASGVEPSGIFGSSIVVNQYETPLQFTRDVVTWPYVGFIHLTSSPLVQEKAFVVYACLMFIVLTYFVSEYLVRLIDKSRAPPLTFFEREALKGFVVVFAFSDFSSMNTNVDGGFLFDGFIVMLICASLVCSVLSTRTWRAAAFISVAVSISLLLDPAYYPIFIIALAVGNVLHGLTSRRLIAQIKLVAGVFTLTLPVLGFMLLTIHETFATGGSALNYRVLSGAGVLAASDNLSMMNVVRLLGYSWSGMTFAPPSVLGVGASINSLPGSGSPTQILATQGSISFVWVLLTVLAPLLAFSALLFGKYRQLALPFASVSLSGIALTQYALNSWSLDVALNLASIPIIGPAIGTVLAIPDRFVQLASVGYILLTPIAAVGLIDFLLGWRRATPSVNRELRTVGNPQSVLGAPHPWSALPWAQRLRRPRADPHRRPLRAFSYLVLLLVFLQAVAGWQAFDGSFYPARAWPPYVAGNGVPNSAPFDPVTVPSEVATAYTYLRSQPGTSSVYWPSEGASNASYGKGQYFFDAADGPRPIATLPALPYLIDNRMIGSIGPYLRANGVGFIVLQSAPAAALQATFGEQNFRTILTILNSTPGIRSTMLFGDLCVFSVAQPLTPTYPTSLILNYPDSDYQYGALYGLFPQLGDPPAITNLPHMGVSIGFSEPKRQIDVLTPSSLATEQPARNASETELVSSTYLTSPIQKYANLSTLDGTLNASQTPGEVPLGAWTVADWGGGVLNTTYQSGELTWSAPLPLSAASLSFNGTLGGQPGGVSISNPDSASIVAGFTFDYQTLNDFKGNISVISVGESKSLAPTYGTAVAIAPSSNWSHANVTEALPPSSRYFNLRLQVTDFSGIVRFRNLNMSWDLTRPNITIQQGNGQLAIGNWTFTNWGSQPTEISYDNGIIRIGSSSLIPTESVTLNGTYGDAIGGITNPSPSDSAIEVTLSGRLQAIRGFVGTIDAHIIGTRFGSNSAVGQTLDLNYSNDWSEFHVAANFEPGIGNVIAGIQAQSFTGDVQFSNISIGWSFLPVSNNSPFGDMIEEANTVLNIAGPAGEAYLQAQGNGSANGFVIDTPSFLSIVSFPFTGRLSLMGELAISSLVLVNGTLPSPQSRAAVLFTGRYFPNEILDLGNREYTAFPTIDGTAFFNLPSSANGSGSIEYEYETLIEVSYVGMVGWVCFLAATLVFFPLAWKHRSRKG